MVIVLRDHGSELIARHVFEGVVADAAAAPGNFLPDENTEAVAVVEHAARLLIVRKPDEVDTHLLHQLHLLIDEIVGHGGGVASMVLMAVRAAQEQTLAIELEGAVFNKLGVADAEGLA